MLKEKQSAPLDIHVLDAEGKEASLRKWLGKKIVLYFYPKDDTPGCTVEACEFRDANADIQKLGALIIGVSKDAKDSHQKFSKKYKLPFLLWSDPDHKLQDAFGVWKEKTFMGKKYMGTERTTFVINADGTILNVWQKVKPEGHSKEVYEFLKRKK